MNQTIKKKWVKALLSGEYEQGAGKLKTSSGKYCCLGVLRDVINPSDSSFRHSFFDAPNSYLSETLAEKIGITNDVQTELAKLNDQRVPFEMIAGLIDHAL